MTNTNPIMTRLLFHLLSVVATSAIAQSLTPVQLKCEYLSNPHRIDETEPRLNWKVESDADGAMQSAYQIHVASTAENLAAGNADLWDSGKVDSDETLRLVYSGKQLTSRQTCFWKVKSWGADGKPSAWSDVAFWSMGLLDDGDWSANYISYRDESEIQTDTNTLLLPPARQYRKEFTTTREIQRATIYATALGIYELHLNGERVGDTYFAPGWTDYRQRAYYDTYDVTDMVASGDNAIRAWVADGGYSRYVGFGLLTGMGTEKWGRSVYGKTPTVMAQLEIEYTDGSRETRGTDNSWKFTGEGPIREADLLMGEDYDATREMTGWTETGFDDSKWQSAILAEENGQLLSANPHVSAVATEGDYVVVDVGSGSYQFAAPSNLGTASAGLETSEPKDNSLNPDEIDMSGAKALIGWDFRNPAVLERWKLRNNVDVKTVGDVMTFQATGEDPQFALRMSNPVSGNLVLELKARPIISNSVEFYWASPERGFNPTQSTSRKLTASMITSLPKFPTPDHCPATGLRNARCSMGGGN